jgi:hypothetical protein
VLFIAGCEQLWGFTSFLPLDCSNNPNSRLAAHIAQDSCSLAVLLQPSIQGCFANAQQPRCVTAAKSAESQSGNNRSSLYSLQRQEFSHLLVAPSLDLDSAFNFHRASQFDDCFHVPSLKLPHRRCVPHSLNFLVCGKCGFCTRIFTAQCLRFRSNSILLRRSESPWRLTNADR